MHLLEAQDMTQQNWRRVNEPQSDTVAMAAEIRAMRRRFQLQDDAKSGHVAVKAMVRCHV